MSTIDDFLDTWIDLHEILPWLPDEPFFVDNQRRTEIREALNSTEFQTTDIDLANISTEHELLVEIGQALTFPTFYGENWDSMRDILRERGSQHPWHISLLFSSCDSFATADFHGFARAVSVLQGMAAELSSIIERPYGQLELVYLANWSRFP